MNHLATNNTIFHFSFDSMGVLTFSQQVCFDGFRGVFFTLNTILAKLEDQLKLAKTNQLMLVYMFFLSSMVIRLDFIFSAQHLYLFACCFVLLSPSLQEIQKSADIIVQDPLAEGRA